MPARFKPKNLLKTLFSTILAVTLLTISTVIAEANIYDPSSADPMTMLVEEEPGDYQSYTDENGNPKIPLILVHGIHGTKDHFNGTVWDTIESDEVSESRDNYWLMLLGYFNSNNAKFSNGATLTQKYKIYRFHYLSDKVFVRELARSYSIKQFKLQHCIHSYYFRRSKR